jgi:hypothetical protein
MTNDKNVIIRHSKPRKSKAKKLKFWNGRGHGEWMKQHFYIAAYSQADAALLLSAATGINVSWKTEISKFYVQCWGDIMDGITPERGLWVGDWHGDKKVRRLA